MTAEIESGKPVRVGSGHATRRELAGAATRERILAAVAQAFDQRGYLGVNLNSVVQELGLTKGALYYFFPTKEALASEIIARCFDAWVPLAGQALEEHADLLDALVDVTYRVARGFQNDCFTRAGIRLSQERNLIKAELPVPFVGWIERITQLLERGQELGHVRADIHAGTTAHLVVGFFFGAQTLAGQFSNQADLPQRLDAFWTIAEPYLRGGGAS